MRAVTVIALWCLILAGCTRRTTSKSEVFEHYFGVKPPPQASILKASYWSIYGAMGLDEEELILDAKLPGDFVQARMPQFEEALKPNQNQLEELLPFGNVDRALSEALKDAPSWFQPPDQSNFTLVASGREFVVFSFDGAGSASRFQMWLSEQGSGRLFIDRSTGHIYVHHTVP